MKVAIEIELSEEPGVAALPGREAIAEALREIMIPPGMDALIHLRVEGHQYTVTGLRPMRNSELI
jgi:hypothetical protein